MHKRDATRSRVDVQYAKARHTPMDEATLRAVGPDLEGRHEGASKHTPQNFSRCVLEDKRARLRRTRLETVVADEKALLRNVGCESTIET